MPTTLLPRFIQLHPLADQALAQDAIQGLRAEPAQVSPKYLYDALGSRLFDVITELPEYYPTRTEAAIFSQHGPEITRAALAITGPGPVVVDLGAGNCAKAAALFPLLDPGRYVAVDISTDYLQQALHGLQRQYPALDLVGVGQDFSSHLALPAELVDRRALVFYPGSSIGNFSPPQALHLLRQARTAAAGGGLLIGVDRLKPAAVLEAAYDDELGVTAAFNLNLLQHLNRLIGSDFAPRGWRHVALFNAQAARIEMHLEARAATTVRWPGGERRFAAGERIHTENSYKWTPEGFEALLRQAGFTRVHHWTDRRDWFSVVLASG